MPDGMDPQLPAAIRRSVAAANAAARASGATNVPDDPDAPPPAPVEPPVPETPPAPEPVQPVAATPPADETWEQRYRSMKGRYDKDVPALQNQVASMEGRLTSLTNLLATVQAPPAPTPTAPPASAVDLTEDIAEYGEPLVNAARKWAKAELMPHITRLEDTVRRLEGSTMQTQTTQTQTMVMQQLDNDPVLAGKWRDINTQPAFVEWLKEADPFSGAKRLDLLTNAYDTGNVARTAAFFKSYLAEHTTVTAPPPATPPPPAQGTGRVALEDLAAPGRAAAQSPRAPGAEPEVRRWTPASIAQLYRDKTKGVFNGRDADFAALERDLIAAPAEGRMLP